MISNNNSMQYFYSDDISGSECILDSSESTHTTKVLRKGMGDEIFILDGKGKMYVGPISAIGKQVKISPLTIKKEEQRPKLQLTITISPTKRSERMEWMIEKLTEIGVARIVFINTEKGERPRVNLNRLKKKAVSALKQSGNLWLPKIHDATPFDTFVKEENSEIKFIAHCFDSEKSNISDQLSNDMDVCVMIGPEGDFSTQEIETANAQGFKPLSLGIPRYRTETAALVACTLINHFCVTLRTN